MAGDDFTLHTYRALKECPQGQQPGETFKATRDAGDVLVSVGAAERVESDEPPKTRNPPYKRRDIRAED